MTDSTWAESDASNTAPLSCSSLLWTRGVLEIGKGRGNNCLVVLIPALLALQKCGRLSEGMGYVKERELNLPGGRNCREQTN